jgi:hypothetical protein
VACVSLLIACYLTWHLLGGLGSRMVAGNADDVRLFMWYLQHGAWAVVNLHDPLYFTTMNAPVGVNGMWNTSLLVPAVLMTPVTLLAGPLVSYNVLFALGLATGPACAFPLMRRFVRSDWAAGLGAVVFGFSPPVLASGLGHINLVLTGLMPLMLLLVHDLVTGRIGSRAGGIALGLATAVQLFSSEELLFQAGLVVLVAGALAAASQPRALTAGACGRIARGLAIEACVFAIIAAGPLWLQFAGPLHQHGSPFTLSFFEADLRGFYVPSGLYWLTTHGSSAFAASYGGGAPEYMAYLGIPLLLTALVVGLARIRDKHARLLLGTGLIFAVFSLGGTLLVDGRQTTVLLPWGTLENWPVFGSALPGRFAFVVALAAAGLLATGVDWLLADGRASRRALAFALAAACVVPLVPRPYPGVAAGQPPPFFAAAGRWLPAGSTVLVLPYPTGTQTQPLAWQAVADMFFQMPGGYFIGPAWNGQAYVGGGGPTPTANTLIQIEQSGAAPAITAAIRAQFWRDVRYWKADAIVAGPGAKAALTGFIQQLLRRLPRRVGGVLLWRLRQPSASATSAG